MKTRPSRDIQRSRQKQYLLERAKENVTRERKEVLKKKSEQNLELQKWMLFQKIEQKEMIRVKLAGLEQCSLKSDLF